MQNYTDFDYDDLPPVDLDLDLHWIQLPQAKLREREAARREAEHQRRLTEVPENHRVILVPAHPTYSPFQQEIWPIINLAVQRTLESYPDVERAVVAEVERSVHQYTGWRNADPPNPEHPHLPKVQPPSVN